MSNSALQEAGPSEVRCGWCSVLMTPGTLPVSHGICDECKAKYFPA